MKTKRFEQGLTTIEIMTAVAAVIVLITGLVVISSQAKQRANVELARTEVEMLATATEQFRGDSRFLPNSGSDDYVDRLEAYFAFKKDRLRVEQEISIETPTDPVDTTAIDNDISDKEDQRDDLEDQLKAFEDQWMTESAKFALYRQTKDAIHNLLDTGDVDAFNAFIAELLANDVARNAQIDIIKDKMAEAGNGTPEKAALSILKSRLEDIINALKENKLEQARDALVNDGDASKLNTILKGGSSFFKNGLDEKISDTKNKLFGFSNIRNDAMKTEYVGLDDKIANLKEQIAGLDSEVSGLNQKKLILTGEEQLSTEELTRVEEIINEINAIQQQIADQDGTINTSKNQLEFEMVQEMAQTNADTDSWDDGYSFSDRDRKIDVLHQLGAKLDDGKKLKTMLGADVPGGDYQGWLDTPNELGVSNRDIVNDLYADLGVAPDAESWEKIEALGGRLEALSRMMADYVRQNPAVLNVVLDEALRFQILNNPSSTALQDLADNFENEPMPDFANDDAAYASFDQLSSADWFGDLAHMPLDQINPQDFLRVDDFIRKYQNQLYDVTVNSDTNIPEFGDEFMWPPEGAEFGTTTNGEVPEGAEVIATVTANAQMTINEPWFELNTSVIQQLMGCATKILRETYEVSGTVPRSLFEEIEVTAYLLTQEKDENQYDPKDNKDIPSVEERIYRWLDTPTYDYHQDPTGEDTDYDDWGDPILGYNPDDGVIGGLGGPSQYTYGVDNYGYGTENYGLGNALYNPIYVDGVDDYRLSFVQPWNEGIGGPDTDGSGYSGDGVGAVPDYVSDELQEKAKKYASLVEHQNSLQYRLSQLEKEYKQITKETAVPSDYDPNDYAPYRSERTIKVYVDPWGNPYLFIEENSGDAGGKEYLFRSFGPDGKDDEGQGDDITTGGNAQVS